MADAGGGAAYARPDVPVLAKALRHDPAFASPPTPLPHPLPAGAGAKRTCGDTRNADYNAQDWAISLSELLRIIQFFNIGGYHFYPLEDPPTEDSYCVGVP
ncbi:MAG: hypothetical protein IT368_00900 [Candidatus Hydrogenedentes bacterium]|nr:hypothetical protein [Candidatus Hydrogenedentota bacterium]